MNQVDVVADNSSYTPQCRCAYMSKPKIVIAEDDFLIREGCMLPLLEPEFEIVASDVTSQSAGSGVRGRPQVEFGREGLARRNTVLPTLAFLLELLLEHQFAPFKLSRSRLWVHGNSHQLKLADCFVIGDSPEDIRAARPLGARGCLVRTGWATDPAVVEKAAPDASVVVNSLGEAADWILHF